MAELTDKGGPRFGSGGFQRISPAEAGLDGVPNDAELEPSGGVPHRLGEASEDGGVRCSIAGNSNRADNHQPSRGVQTAILR